MRNLIFIFFVSFLALVGLGCGDSPSSGLTVNGSLTNASAMQVYFDNSSLGGQRPNHVVSNTEMDANGNFSFNFPEGLEAGIYQVRVGLKKATIVLDGTESLVTISGDLNAINRFGYNVSGSQSSASFVAAMQALVSRQMQSTDVANYVDTTANPLAGAMIASLSLRNRQFVPIHEKAKARLEEALPGSAFINDYNTYLAAINKVQSGGRGFQFIPPENRQVAPDIKLADPDGKDYALSDLKGQVVLLDFWASWCGPCRRENPNVVEVYKKYKDRGFTVYSVSLDGLDSRSRARYNDETQIQQQLERSKDRWVKAIAQDNLLWEYHVSDLKKWECAPAKQYGVSSIPRTFLIDREGKIAATNLRGAHQIEENLLKLL